MNWKYCLKLFRNPWSLATLGIGLILMAPSLTQAQTSNMDTGLAALVRLYELGLDPLATNQVPGTDFTESYANLALTDSQGRVLVEIYLSGAQSFASVQRALVAADASISGENRDYRQGVFSAYIPFSSAVTLARTPGVSAMTLAYRPIPNTGSVTSQGTTVIRSNVANAAGFTGAGITVGVLSDSYNTSSAAFTMIRESNDIASQDLPPVPQLKLVIESPFINTDEGRAMMQIVADVARDAKLCFATGYPSTVNYAINIKRLRTDLNCRADVIVDDLVYFTEPFFSDGQVAQAVNDVVNKPSGTGSTMMAGKRVAYFSAAGNQQGQGFLANPAKFVSATSVPGVNLATIATCSVSNGSNPASVHDVGGGFLDFGAGVLTKSITFFTIPNVSTAKMVLQWDDLFDGVPNGITTDLNILLFQGGNCVLAIGADNFSTNQAVEVIVGINGGPATMMIARTSVGTHLASRVKIIAFEGISSPIFGNASVPVTFGHSAAAGAIAVAAYQYSSDFALGLPAFESFSSPGPVTIAFDKSGNRLPVAETRKKPDIAAPDGVDTTFFYPGVNPADGTPSFPNFFGTSAAAPHAAGVAALLLQKAGGPSTLLPQTIKSVLQTTARARIISPYTSPSKLYSPFDGYGLIDAVDALSRIVLPGPCLPIVC